MEVTGVADRGDRPKCTGPSSETHSSLWGQLLALAFLALVIGGYFFTGLYGSDDLQYVAGAIGLGGDIPAYATLGGGRYTVTVPLRLFLELGGGDPQLAVVGFTAVYLAIVLGAYLLIAQIHNKATAFVAAALIAANPLLFIYSGAVLPDNILAMSFACAVILLARWGFGSDTRRTRGWLLVLVGVFAGLCYVTKEASLIFFPPLCVYTVLVAIARGGIRELAAAVAIGLLGFCVVLAVDMALSAYLFGHPFSRLTYAAELDLVVGVRHFMEKQGTYPWERFGTVWDQLWVSWPAVIVYLIGALYLIQLRGSVRAFLLSMDGVIALSVAWTFGYLTWGSVSFREYIGVPLQERYYAPCALLLCILMARAVVEFVERHLAGREWVARIGLALLVGWQVLWPLERAGNIYRAAEHREFRAAIASQRLLSPGTPIFVDHYFNMRGARYGHLPVTGSLASGRPAEPSFVYIFNERERPRSAAEKAVLGCLGTGARDVSNEGRAPSYQTRLDAMKAGLGFHDSVATVQSRVGAILVEDMDRCARAPG